MAISITHTFVSPVADAGNPNEVGPDEWNAAHTVSGTLPAANVEAAGNDTEVQFNDAGAFAGDTSLTWNKTSNTLTLPNIVSPNGTGTGNGTALTLTAGSAIAANGNGGAVTITGGTGVNNGDGGDINLIGGTAGAGDAIGGDINVTAGSSTNNDRGGAVTVTAGTGGPSGGSGGTFSLTAGDGGSSSGDGGAFTMRAGSAQTAGVGGSFTMDAGDGEGTGRGGNFEFQAGGGGNTNGDGGEVVISAGNSPAADGGSITLNAGTGSSSDGNIILNNAPADGITSIRIGSALTNTVNRVLELRHTTSGTPANGIGVGVQFLQETSDGNNEVIAAIDATVVDVTSTSEDAAIVFKTMTAGAALAEVGRFEQTSTATHTSLMLYDVDNGTVERVTVGAADSGGTGFKVLCIPN